MPAPRYGTADCRNMIVWILVIVNGTGDPGSDGLAISGMKYHLLEGLRERAKNKTSAANAVLMPRVFRRG